MKQVKYYYEDGGWYAEVSGKYFIDTDSLKADFLVPVDLYDEDQGEELAIALQEAYPDHQIIWSRC
jgi:hypothetical protein